MNKPKVLIAQRLPMEVQEYIQNYCDCEIWDSEYNRDEFLRRVSDKEGIILSGIAVDIELLKKAPKLKVVSNVSVGYNNFDIEAMKERGIIGTTTPGSLDETVADLIFALMLASSRRIAELDKYVKEGRWKKGDNENLFGLDVHHSTLGIVGMGRIGEAVAKRARFGFDMEVLYSNRNRKPEAEDKLGAKYCDLKELLSKADFILLMTPLTKETYHLIDYKEFDMMKKNAIFINASRGQTVNEAALIDALLDKKILGAGLDVYEKEPVNIENPLLKMHNVVTVPHIGSATEKTRFDMAMLAAKSLVTALSGKIPDTVVPELRIINK